MAPPEGSPKTSRTVRHPVAAVVGAWGGICVVAIVLLIVVGGHGLLGLLWVAVVVSLLQLVLRVREAHREAKKNN